MLRFIISATLAVLALTACQSTSTPPPPPAPTEALVSAMRDYCRIGELPADQQRDARKAWGFQIAGGKDVGPVWNRAVVKKDPAAKALIWAAAEAAVGKGNCPVLDPLGR